MDMVTRLEEKFDQLLKKIDELKNENQHLKEELELERGSRGEAMERLEALLQRIEGELE
ncbi:hypothetical protein [Salidesulfovibrio onnuriiensis]|uniref:hypothetical protein n=1 Tax=Salidesulfovibrio onnuriiensis TaxID=2583823 RepID=UPI00165054D9|nr:hypothetical protein [Salidesulfovibrio onnuriiensis]